MFCHEWGIIKLNESVLSAPVCLLLTVRFTGEPVYIGTSETVTSHPSFWWSDKGIQAFACTRKKGLQGAKSRSKSPMSQVWGAMKGARPWARQTSKLPTSLREHRHLQGFLRRWNEKEKRGKKRKVRWCRLLRKLYRLQWSQCSTELTLGTCVCELRADWCACVTVSFLTTKEP